MLLNTLYTPEKPVEAVKPFETVVVAVQAAVEEWIADVQADGRPTQPEHQPSHDAPAAEHAGRPQEPAAQPGYHHQQVYPTAAAQAAPVRQQVRDEFCLDDFYKILQEQSKSKENQMRDLSEKRSFGFKPDSAKKPF